MMLCWGRIVSDGVCRRVLRNELTSLASLQRTLLSLLQKHLHLQEKIQRREAISSSCSPHSVAENQKPSLPSTSTASRRRVSEPPKKKQVVSQKGGKINGGSAPKQGLKRRVLSGPSLGPPGEAAVKGQRHPHGTTPNVGVRQRKTFNTGKNPMPPMNDTPALREYSGTGTDLSVVLSPGGALQLLWRVSLSRFE